MKKYFDPRLCGMKEEREKRVREKRVIERVKYLKNLKRQQNYYKMIYSNFVVGSNLKRRQNYYKMIYSNFIVVSKN